MSTVNTDLWEVEFYDKSNSAQFRDGLDLYNEVLKKNISRADIIVEIGCGTGNITEMLAKKIQHTRLYACDFNPNMVEYANKTHNDGTIEYFVQDISLPWEKLDERLRNLEGKVDLVWSNRVLHWLNEDEEKENAAKTIARLLKPGGNVFLNISQRRDLNEFLSEEEKQESLKQIKFESHEHQYNTWKNILEKSGLSLESFELLPKDWKFGTLEEYNDQFQYKAIEGFIRSVANQSLSDEEKDNLVKRIHPLIVKQFHTKYGQDFQTQSNSDVLHIYNEMFQVIGKK